MYKKSILSPISLGLILALFCAALVSCSSPAPTANPTSPLSAESSLPTPAPTAMSPANLTGSIVYHARVGENNQIFVLTLSTGATKQLTDAGNNTEPSWSSDGTEIVYACNAGTNSELCAMNADGSNQQQLTHTSNNNWGPDWSPDGTQIVFVSDQEPFSHLYILDVASGNIKRLNNAPGNEGAPKWSPDGSQIIFMSDRNRSFNLYTIHPDGTGEKQITTFGQDDRPNWSPDGKRITFRRLVVSTSLFSGIEIMVANSDGTNIQQLTSDNDAEDWPAFSPDGKWIVYSLETDTSTLQIIPSDGGAPSPLIAGGISGRAPDWKP